MAMVAISNMLLVLQLLTRVSGAAPGSSSVSWDVSRILSVDSEQQHPHTVLLVICGSLLIGAMIRHLSKIFSFPIPYTVSLLVAGALIGTLVSEDACEQAFELGCSAGMVANIDPHLMLYIFLPPLIFESAFSMDFHIFLKSKWKCLILAGPGLVFCVAILGTCIKYWLYPDQSWETCFLLSAILSATDPVAVVALLKELGASKKLGTLIEGESLLNDGTAMVVFLVLFKKVKDPSLEMQPGTIVAQFIQMSVGGPLFGLACGMVVLWLIGRVFNDAAVEITVSLSSAYLTFYFAEADLGLSGILAVVALGLTFASFGHTKVSPEVMHFNHEFWMMLGYLCNTIIFIVTGIIIFSERDEQNRTFMGEMMRDHWEKLIAIYFLCAVVRTSLLALCYYPFQRFDYGFTWGEVLVCSWGGLRGAVGLALAVVVFVDTDIPQSTKEMVFFNVAGIVLLTLLVNATTMKLLLSKLGMLKISAAKVMILKQAGEQMKAKLASKVADLKQSQYYAQSKFDLVQRFTDVDFLSGISEQSDKASVENRIAGEDMLNAVRRHRALFAEATHAEEDNIDSKELTKNELLQALSRSPVMGRELGLSGASLYTETGRMEFHKLFKNLDSDNSGTISLHEFSTAISQNDTYEKTMRAAILLETRRTALADMVESFKKQYSSGQLGQLAYKMLLDAAEDAGDEIDEDEQLQKTQGFDDNESVLHAKEHVLRWDSFREYLMVNNWLENFADVKTLGIGRFVQRIIYERLTFGIDIANGYLNACQHVYDNIGAHKSFKDLRITQMMQQHLNMEMEKTRKELYDMNTVFPEIFVSISSRHSTRILLNYEKQYISQLNAQGILDEGDKERLRLAVEDKIRKMDRMPPWVPLPSKRELLREIPWLRELSHEAFDLVAQRATEQVFSPEQKIVGQGELGSSVYLIARGVCTVDTETHGSHAEHHLGVGQTVGEMVLLTGCKQDDVSVIAQTTMLTFRIRQDHMWQTMAQHPALVQSLWTHAAEHITQGMIRDISYSGDHLHDHSGKYEKITDEELKEMIRQWKMTRIEPRSPSKTKDGGGKSKDKPTDERAQHIRKSSVSVGLFSGGLRKTSAQETQETPQSSSIIRSEGGFILLHGICYLYPTRELAENHKQHSNHCVLDCVDMFKHEEEQLSAKSFAQNPMKTAKNTIKATQEVLKDVTKLIDKRDHVSIIPHNKGGKLPEQWHYPSIGRFLQHGRQAEKTVNGEHGSHEHGHGNRHEPVRGIISLAKGLGHGLHKGLDAAEHLLLRKSDRSAGVYVKGEHNVPDEVRAQCRCFTGPCYIPEIKTVKAHSPGERNKVTVSNEKIEVAELDDCAEDDAENSALSETASRKGLALSRNKNGATFVIVEGSRIVTKLKTSTLLSRVQMLNQFVWISACKPEVGEQLAEASMEVVFKPGEPLCLEGEVGDCLFIVTYGTVLVERNIRAKKCVLARKGWGWCIGELAMLSDNKQRTATVTAHGHVRTLCINYAVVNEIMAEHSELRDRLFASAGHSKVFSLLVTLDFFKAWTLPRLHDYCFDWKLHILEDETLLRKIHRETPEDAPLDPRRIDLPFVLVKGKAVLYDTNGNIITEYNAPSLITKKPSQLAMTDFVHITSDQPWVIAAKTTFTRGAQVMTPPGLENNTSNLCITNQQRKDALEFKRNRKSIRAKRRDVTKAQKILASGQKQAAPPRSPTRKVSMELITSFRKASAGLVRRSPPTSPKNMTRSLDAAAAVGTMQQPQWAPSGGAGQTNSSPIRKVGSRLSIRRSRKKADAATEIVLKKEELLEVPNLGFSGTQEEEEAVKRRRRNSDYTIDWQQLGETLEGSNINTDMRPMNCTIRSPTNKTANMMKEGGRSVWRSNKKVTEVATPGSALIGQGSPSSKPRRLTSRRLGSKKVFSDQEDRMENFKIGDDVNQDAGEENQFLFSWFGDYCALVDDQPFDMQTTAGQFPEQAGEVISTTLES